MQPQQIVTPKRPIFSPRGPSLPLGVVVLPVMFDKDEIARILAEAKPVVHHDDGGHGINREKKNDLTWVAKKILPFVAQHRCGAHSVDAKMKLYRLGVGNSAVAEHVDEDYDGPEGTIARDSILVYLNDNFAGGDTIFCGHITAPHGGAGSGLLFNHRTPHKGLPVFGGIKLVLKTDLFLVP